MSELLPCCQCGESKGYNLSEGSTYRWWSVECMACGGDFGECSADRTINLQKGSIPERWEWADEHWNQCNAYAQKLRERIKTLESAVRWALGETNFRQREEGEGAYWWRKELRERANVPYITPDDNTAGYQAGGEGR